MFQDYDTEEFLEPKCPKCGTLLDYGENTTYDEKKDAHICNKCKTQL